MLVKANAKINIALNVVAKKANGYHELDMIMVPLALSDDVYIETSDQDYVEMEVDIALDDNTVYQALKLFKEYTNDAKCYHIKVDKKIPMQAGLAGGSSDAAAVLLGLNQINNQLLTFDELLQLGEKIGADVPFCLYKQLARVKGIGEKLAPINCFKNFDVLLVKPASGVSTKAAFENLDFTKLAHPNIDEIIHKMEHDEPFLSLIDNSLEESALRLNGDIAQVKADLEKYNLQAVLMSGSGSCVFAIDELAKLQSVYQELKTKYPFVCLTKTI